MGPIILTILAAIIIGAIVTSLKKSKVPENKGGDVEPGKGDLGTGEGKTRV